MSKPPKIIFQVIESFGAGTVIDSSFFLFFSLFFSHLFLFDQISKSKPPNPKSKMGASKRFKIICWKGLKSSVYDFRPLVGAYPKV